MPPWTRSAPGTTNRISSYWPASCAALPMLARPPQRGSPEAESARTRQASRRDSSRPPVRVSVGKAGERAALFVPHDHGHFGSVYMHFYVMMVLPGDREAPGL